MGSVKERGMGAVRKDEPLGKSSSLVASAEVAAAKRVSAKVDLHVRWVSLHSSETSMSVFSGLGCWIVSRSFACSLSARAFSTGPNTPARSLVRFAFLLLARAPFAIVK